jgi:hypothetical protein
VLAHEVHDPALLAPAFRPRLHEALELRFLRIRAAGHVLERALDMEGAQFALKRKTSRPRASKNTAVGYSCNFSSRAQARMSVRRPSGVTSARGGPAAPGSTRATSKRRSSACTGVRLKASSCICAQLRQDGDSNNTASGLAAPARASCDGSCIR